VGPSGVGKGTLINCILEKYGGLFERKISYTTRAKKAYEKSQGQYNFITKEDFMRVRISMNDVIVYRELRETNLLNGAMYMGTFMELHMPNLKESRLRV
jgi:guanylate kinase